MIKAVLFDLDGCLVDACHWHEEAFNDALNEVCGFKLTKEEHLEHFNALTTRQKLQRLVDESRIESDLVDRVWSLKQEKTEGTIQRLAVNDLSKVKMHTWLHEQGIRTACVTNSIRKSAELMLRRTGQYRFMEFVITNQDVILPKPHGEGYIRAMIKLGIEPDEVLIVEDSPKGLLAAQSTGAHIMKVNCAEDVNLNSIMKYVLDDKEIA